MKICLYLEFYHFLGGFLYKKVGTGLLTSFKNQKDVLNKLKIDFCESWQPDCDILQINTPWIKSVFLMKRAKRQGKKVIVWSHVTAEDAKQVFRFMPLILPLFKKYLSYAYNQADIIFCPSLYTKGLLIAYGIAEKKLIVQSNGVDTEKFFSQKKIESKNIIVGTVALAIPRKGINTFLNLAKSFPKNQFIWYGKIYHQLLVKSLPKEIPSNAKFTGYVDDILKAYNSLDIFIFPSYEENQGMAILEAAAIGLPILVRDIPVYSGWLEHHVNCLKAKTEEEFTQCLKMLIENKELRNRLGKAALALAQEESLFNQAKKMEIIYNLIIKENKHKL